MSLIKIHKYYKIYLKSLKAILYFAMLVVVILIITIVTDLSFKSQKTKKTFTITQSFDQNKQRIDNPKFVFEENDKNLHIIMADYGFIKTKNNLIDSMILYEVRVNSFLGTVVAGELQIKDNQNILEFRQNPEFLLKISKN